MLQPGKLALQKGQPQGLSLHLNLSASKPMIDSTKQQQFTMRDDVIQFSHNIVNSARSQFHFRKRNSVHTARQGSQGFSREIKKMMKKQNEKFREVSFELENGKDNRDSKDDTDDKSGRYNKREVFTSDHSGSSSRHKIGGRFKISKTQSMQMDKINKIMPANITNSVLQKPTNSSQQLVSAKKPSISQIPKPSAPLFKSFNSPGTPVNHSSSLNQTNYLNLQRKHNKSVLTDSSVQGWLNQALIQASPNIVVDKNQNNAGLKVYNIDRSSLIKLGLHQDHVNRLYRSLFVYSLGFNNLLAECCGPNNKMLRNNIWKAFAVLLEYCSGGNFSTTIGQIQRDKQQKLSILRSQIQKRQKQLQHQDEQSQKKNMKILKECRELQKQVKQLEQQRDVILQQYHQAEQAFNQQIALRLKYQTRINQIHGVYEELSQKYKLTREELQKDKVEIGQLKGVVEGLRVDIGKLNVQLSLSNQENTSLKTQLAHLSQANHTLTQKNTLTTTSLLTAKNQTQSHIQSLSSQSRANQNLTLSLQNQKSTSQSLFKTLQSKSEQFEKAMKQNAQLHQHIQRDTQEINSLLEELRNVRVKHVELQAMMEIYERKNKQWEQKVGELRGKVEKLEEGMKKKQIQIKLEIQKRESVEKDIQKCHQSIKQMKATQNTLRQQLQQSQNMVGLLQNQIASQKERIQKLIVEIQGYKTKIHQLRVQLNQKQSTINMLTEQLKSTNQQWQLKNQNLQSQLTTQTNQTEAYKSQTHTLQTQLQQLSQSSQKTYSQLKNQRFQRNNLELYYKQSLTVMEEQIAHIKQLSIQISEMTQALEDGKRKYLSLELIHKNKVQMLERDVGLWRREAEVQGRLFKDMVGYVHPMIKEDLQAEVNRLLQKIADRQSKLKQSTKKQKQFQKTKFTLQQQLKKTQTKTTQQLQNLYNNQIEKQNQQINYLQQKMSYQSQKLQQIQSQLQKSNEQKKTYYDHLRKMEADFMDKINDKNKELGLVNQKYRQLLSQYEEQLKSSSHHGRHGHGHGGGKSDEDKELREKIAKLEMELKIHIDRQRQRERQKHGKNDHSPSPQKKGDKKNGKQTHQNDNKKKNGKEDSQQNEQQKRLREESKDNESQGQKLKSKQQQKNGEQSMQMDVDASKTGAQNFKKREQMRKKIKGAYLYYLK